MIWTLPESAELEGRIYPIRTDFRDVLEIIAYLNGPLPEFIRWQVALRLFYREPVPPEHQLAAARYLCRFLAGGESSQETPGPKLMDWQQDAGAIVSDINRVAGTEIRKLDHLHWWTFLGWFHAIGEGQLSMLVSLREKLRTGQKLTPAEQSFYRRNKDRVDLKRTYTPQEIAERARLEKLLGG